MTGIEITRGWQIPWEDVEFRYVTSSGPGGQNVNKLATKVELRFQLAATKALSPAQKRRLVEKYPAHATLSGSFVLASDRHRSQARNQQDAVERLVEMLRSIRFAPKPRVPTKPSRASKRKRVETKRRMGERKRQRQQKDFD